MSVLSHSQIRKVIVAVIVWAQMTHSCCTARWTKHLFFTTNVDSVTFYELKYSYELKYIFYIILEINVCDI